MPYNFSDNIQRGILYLYKTDKEFHLEIGNLIQPEYFEFPIHQNIFRASENYYNKYCKLPNNDFLLEDLRKIKGKDEDLSEYSEELGCIDTLDASSYENKEYILDLVEDFAKKESIKDGIKECVTLINDGNIDACEDVVRKALLVTRDIDTGQNYLNSVSERWRRTIEHKDQIKFPTIFPTCNGLLEGGNNAKELCMVIAPPGVGKSLYLANQAVRSMSQNKKVLYVTLEMSEDKIAQRIDSILCCLPNSGLKNPGTQLELDKRLKLFQQKCPGADLFIKEFPTGCANVNTLRALLVQLKNYHEFIPDLIIVDYLELLRPCRTIEAEYQAQQRIAEELRGLGMENNVLIWTATQTNRQGKKVSLIDDTELGDSYGKIRVADWAISLNQTQEEYDNGKMRVYIVKARDSKQKYTVRAKVDYNTLRINEQETVEDLEEQVKDLL